MWRCISHGRGVEVGGGIPPSPRVNGDLGPCQIDIRSPVGIGGQLGDRLAVDMRDERLGGGVLPRFDQALRQAGGDALGQRRIGPECIERGAISLPRVGNTVCKIGGAAFRRCQIR